MKLCMFKPFYVALDGFESIRSRGLELHVVILSYTIIASPLHHYDVFFFLHPV